MWPARVCHFSPRRIEDLLLILFIVWCCLPSLSKVCLHVDFHPLSYFSLKGHSLTLSGGEEATFKTWLRCWSSTNSHSGVLWCTRRTLRNHSGVRRYGRSKGTHLHCLRSYHRSYPATRHTSELHQPCVFVSLLGLVFWVYDILLLVALDWNSEGIPSVLPKQACPLLSY